MKRIFFLFFALNLFFSLSSGALAYVAASPNYRLEKDSINTGGTELSSSASYLVSDTIGELISGLGDATSNISKLGYRFMEVDTALIVVGCTDSTANNYNSSAIADDGSCTYTTGTTGTTIVTPPTPPPPGPIIEPVFTPTPPPGVTSATSEVSLAYLPVSTTTPDLDWKLFFVQPEEKVKTFDWRGAVRLSGEKPLTILFNLKTSSEFLKTIGITLTDPEDKNKTFSFLMRRSPDGLSYQATLSPLIRAGTYPIDIYIINYQNQTIRHLTGKLVIPSNNILRLEAIVNQLAPIAVTGGLLVGFFPTIYDLLFSLFRFLGYFFGRRRHDKPWGTVYDSVTKRPLDPVYIIAEQVGPDGQRKEVASAISDIDGRFSFFLPAGTYYLKAAKSHYQFPSVRLKDKREDEIYNDLYFGTPIVVTGQEVINLNIPMDPIEFDWNEFAKTKTDFFLFYDRRQVWLKRLYDFFFGLGFVLAIYFFLLYPSTINLAIVLLYAGVVLLNRVWLVKRKPLRILRESNHEPLSYSIIRVFLPDINQQVKTVVADKFGRFYLLIRPGVYYYTVEEKQLDGSYLKTYQSSPVNLSKGILTGDIYVK
ncbi:MAG TPA: carboxypeptidase-like regulatory domain-containing protein [Candidatus Paceibacterota bacterium]|nr:carboxypeptidase-like regulatory domain-containing protein [Candidatus Paceibacterota bacterium]